MQVSVTLLAALAFMLIAQGAFAAVLLLVKSENRIANRYLLALIIVLCLWLLDAFFAAANIYAQQPDLYFLPIYFSFALGPLLYMYTKALTQPPEPFGKYQLWHFAPAILQGSFYLFLSCKAYAFRRWFWFEVHRPYTYDLELMISFAILLVYLSLGLRELKSYRARIENQFSELSRITLRWLRNVHLVLGVLAFFWLLESTGRLVWDYYAPTPLSYLTIGFAIIFLAAGGLLQDDLRPVAGDFLAEEDNQEDKSQQRAYDPAHLDLIRREMVRQELFLEPSLSLKTFARAVGLPPREVSRAINQGIGVSFIDFVNDYRVARFQALVDAGELTHLSLLGLALESGFSAKSTFNRVFRKSTGKSPSDYQKEAQSRH